MPVEMLSRIDGFAFAVILSWPLKPWLERKLMCAGNWKLEIEKKWVMI